MRSKQRPQTRQPQKSQRLQYKGAKELNMSLTTFSTGLSGLYTSSEALNVVGNNLANLNTAGYKASDISFSDVLGEQFTTPGTAASGNTASIGLGAQVSSVRANFGQGSLKT